MPAVAKFNLIDGTSLDLSPNTSRKVTRGIVTGITADSVEDPEVIWRAVQACTDAGYGMNVGLTGHEALVLNRLVVRGLMNDGCVVDLYHETPNFGGSPISALLVRHRSFMTQREANTFFDLNGNRQPIKILPFTDEDGNVIKQDYATINYLHPARAIQVSGLTYGMPSNGGETLVGSVNSTPWQGLPKGYWLMSEFETDVSRYQNYYTFSMTAISRVTIDWGEIAILRSELTGKYVKIPDGTLAIVNAAEYTNNLLVGDGITKVGPFPMANLASIFGIF